MKIVTLGVHVLDVLGRPVPEIPPGQSSTRLDEIRITPAGTAAGAAVDLAVFGADVVSIGAVGDDEIGEFLVHLLRRRGVDTRGVVVLPGPQTSASMLPIRPNGDRPALHVVGANGQVSLGQLDLLLLEGADAIHLGGLERMAGLDRRDVFELLEAVQATGAFVSMDLISAPRDLGPWILDWLPYVDVVLPNDDQASGLCGTDNPRAAAMVLRDHGAGAAAITLGGEGSFYLDDEHELWTPAIDVDVQDTTGCGDAFCAAFLIGTLRGSPVPEVLRHATAAAGLVASGLGSDHGLRSWAHVEATVVAGRVTQAIHGSEIGR